jgi:hypothetical protein
VLGTEQKLQWRTSASAMVGEDTGEHGQPFTFSTELVGPPCKQGASKPTASRGCTALSARVNAHRPMGGHSPSIMSNANDAAGDHELDASRRRGG